MQALYLQRIMKKNADKSYEKTNPIQTQFQTRSAAEIPTGELTGILKPGTNQIQYSLAKTMRFATLQRPVVMAHLSRYRLTKWNCQINYLELIQITGLL